MTEHVRPSHIEEIKISSREQWLDMRKKDVTASVVGALFGAHDYETPLGLYASKTGVPMKDPDNAVLRRGRLLENAVATAFAEEHPGWSIEKADVYLRDPRVRLGATPDFFCRDPKGKRVVLQAKTVGASVFRNKWTEENPPFWITLQTLTETMLDGADYGVVAALVVSEWNLDLYTYNVPRHEAGEKRIRDAVGDFWKNVAEKKPPNVDYSNDAALISVMYRRPKIGKLVDLTGDNRIIACLEERAAEMIKRETAKRKVEELEAEIKAKIGDAEAAIVPGWKVSWTLVEKEGFVVEPTTYRRLNARPQQMENPES